MNKRFNIMKKIDVSKSLIFDSTVNDVKNSLEYLNQKGYFSNSKDFLEYKEAYLGLIEVSNIANFIFTPYKFMQDGFRNSFSYFIPKSKAVFVEEEPKKKTLRPFKSLEEFFNVTGFKVGDIVQIKRFGNLNYEETAILTSFKFYLDGAYRRVEICFGSTARSLNDLFKCCKYFKNNEWLPFGVEE